MNSRLRQIFLHLIGWIIFLLLPVLFFPGPKNFFSIVNDPRTIADASRYLLFILFFYLNYHYLVPQFYFTKKYWLFGFAIIITYLVIVYLPGIFFVPSPPPFNRMPPPPEPMWDLSFKFGRHLSLFLLVFFFSLILRISDRLKQTEEARRKAELSYLQAQINPHFLFNTLNSIYSLSIEKSDQVADAVVKLSNMMRYVLTEANKPLVSLKKEIDYINGYIDLQKYRVSNTVYIHLTINGEATHQEIAPLLLITFIENAFKYGVNPEVPSEIIIEIDIGTDDMHLLVKNKKATIKNTERTGLGIKNVKQRLEMLYPGKHTLTVHDGTSDFSVSLLINFK